MPEYNIFADAFSLQIMSAVFGATVPTVEPSFDEMAMVDAVLREQRDVIDKLRRDPAHLAKAPGAPVACAKRRPRKTSALPAPRPLHTPAFAAPPLVMPRLQRARCESVASMTSALSDDSGFAEPLSPRSVSPLAGTAVAAAAAAPKPIPLVQPRNQRKPLDQLSDEERNHREQRLQVKAKTSLCHDFVTKGECKYGDACRFAHDKAELRPIETHPKYKTKLCRNFITTGHCAYGWKCQFLHDSAGADSANVSMS